MAHELAHTLQRNCHGKICKSSEGSDKGHLKTKKRPKRFATNEEVEQFLTYLSNPELVDMGIIEQSMFVQAFDLYCSYIEWAERGATAVEFALGESATGAALGTALSVVGIFAGLLVRMKIFYGYRLLWNRW